MISASNSDDGTGDWGKKAAFVFDVHLNPTEIAAQYSTLSIVDSWGRTYNPASATLGADGKTVNLEFVNYNNAHGQCTAKYTPGTITSMAGITLTETSCVFTPTGLVPSTVPVPEVSTIQNV